jgi:hypothetical protein
VFAERFGWTPAEVDALDPDVAAEVVTYLDARADHDAAERRRSERRGRGGLGGEEASIADILAATEVDDGDAPDD